MTVEILTEDDRWSPLGLDRIAAVAAEAVERHLGLPPLDIAILACDDTRIAVLNAEFRGRETPTNVLSWPSEERGAEVEGERPDPPRDSEVGDLAISYDTCAREARAQGKSLADHATHLVVHGILHLLGYDHVRDRDGDLMERTETVILGQLGIADPYGGADAANTGKE